MASSTADALCAGCGEPAPNLEDGTTLRSSKGWRFMREKTSDGQVAVLWHCPSCWKKKKERPPESP